MPADPPSLLVRRHFPRADATLVDRLRGVPTGWVADANGRRGAIDYRIRPLTRTTDFAGVALTVRSRPRDNLAAYAALQFARAGDVMIIATEDYREASVVGDLHLGMAKNRGVVACVTDGLVRDIDGIDELGIPVFARGLSPNSPHKDGPGEIGTAVTIGGVVVVAGDVVVGDKNGVVVVAREALVPVLEALEGVRDKENQMDKAVRGGLAVPEWLPDACATKGIGYLD